MILEHLIVSESKEAIKKQNTLMEVCQRCNWKSSQWPKLKQFEQENKVVLD